jgi:hypothetical protein
VLVGGLEQLRRREVGGRDHVVRRLRHLGSIWWIRFQPEFTDKACVNK